MNTSLRTLLHPVLCGALLASAAAAQFATVTEHAPACANPLPLGNTCTISCTPPVFGTTCTITTRGPRMGFAFLLLSTRAYFQGFDLTPYGSPGCRLYASTAGGVVVPQSLFSGVATHGFTVPSTVPLGSQFFLQALLTNGGPTTPGMLTSNMLVASVGGEPDLTPAQIASFAPIVRLHPNEAYMPMDPMLFVQLSRFRHHRSLQSDQGFNKVTGVWDTTDSHAAQYYDIPVAVVNAYALNTNGTNRRPRDPNSGSSWNVFLQPVGAPTGHQFPGGVVPVFYHYRRQLAAGLHEIQYWWFFGYNDSLASFNHQGDWEHVTVQVSSGRVVGTYFAAHNGGVYHTVPQMTMMGGRPVVYVARGSHAAYATAGSHFGGLDQTADGGYQWDVATRLLPLAAQPWKDFAGAWGEVGNLDTTTGPLGPWHKRNNP